MKKIKKGVLKKFLIYLLFILTFAISSVSASTPTLSTISVGNSTIYKDEAGLTGGPNIWQEQQLISTDANGTADLTIICCENNTDTCTPAMENAVCTDYKPSPYNFECSYQPVRTYGDPFMEPPEETRYLRCAVSDSSGSSAVVSANFTTSLDCQDGSEDPVLPALVGGCSMRHNITLQATPPVPIDPSVTFDTNDVMLDCNNHSYDINNGGIDPAFTIIANGTTIKDCDIYGPKELMGGPLFPPGTSLHYEFVTSANILGNDFYTVATEPNPRFRAINFDWNGQDIDGITIEGNKFYPRSLGKLWSPPPSPTSWSASCGSLNPSFLTDDDPVTEGWASCEDSYLYLDASTDKHYTRVVAVANMLADPSGVLTLAYSDDNVIYTDIGSKVVSDLFPIVYEISFDVGSHRYWRIHADTQQSVWEVEFYEFSEPSGVYFAVKENNNNAGASTFNNFNIKNNYFESGVFHMRLRPFRDASVTGTINIDDNVWYSAGNDIPPSNDAYFATLFGGNINWVVRNNNVSEWYNSTKYWDEPYCSNKEDSLNCVEWAEGPVLVQRSGSVLFENNDIRNVAGVHTFREMNNNSVIIYNNLFQDTGQLEIRTVGANVTKNTFVETPNIVNVVPVGQLVNVVRFTSAEPAIGNYYAHDGIFRDNTITGSRLVRVQGRGFPVNNLVVSDNVLNYVKYGTAQVNETNQIQCYLYNNDYRTLGNTGSGIIHLTGGVYDSLIENNTINNLPDDMNTVVITQWGSHANCPWTTGRYNLMGTGTGNKIRNNFFNENVNQYNTWTASGAEEPVNTYDNNAEPNVWAKPPVVVFVKCTNAASPDSTVCEALVKDVRWYDMKEVNNASIKKGEFMIGSDDVTFMGSESLTTSRYNFTAKPTEAGFWTANVTVTDSLGGVGEGNITFPYDLACSDVYEGLSIESSITLNSNCQYNVSQVTIYDDNVIFDCNGARLDGTMSGGYPVLKIFEGVSNVTIKGCDIISNAQAIELGYGNDIKILDNVLNSTNTFVSVVSDACDSGLPYHGLVVEGNVIDGQGDAIRTVGTDTVFYNNTFYKGVMFMDGCGGVQSNKEVSANVTGNSFLGGAIVTNSTGANANLFLDIEDNVFDFDQLPCTTSYCYYSIFFSNNVKFSANGSIINNNKFYNTGNQTYANGFTFDGMTPPIYLKFVSNVTISNNYFENVTFYGVEFVDCANNFVHDNYAKKAYGLTRIGDKNDSGLDSHHDEIYNNMLDNSEDFWFFGCSAIELRSSHHEHVYNNTIRGCNTGIRLRYETGMTNTSSHSNLIEGNTLTGFRVPGNCSALPDICTDFWTNGDVNGIHIMEGGHNYNIIKDNLIDLNSVGETVAISNGIFLTNSTLPIEHVWIENNTLIHAGNWTLEENNPAWNRSYNGVDLVNYGRGIGIQRSNNITVINNYFEEVTDDSIRSDDMVNSLIAYNFFNNTRGIEIGTFYGEPSATSTNNNISYNTLIGESPIGSVGVTLIYDTSSIVEHNTISGGQRGVVFQAANNSIARYNIIGNLSWNPRFWTGTVFEPAALMMDTDLGENMLMEHNDVYHDQNYTFRISQLVLNSNLTNNTFHTALTTDYGLDLGVNSLVADNYYVLAPRISIDDYLVNEDFTELNYTVDLSVATNDVDNNTQTEVVYSIISQSDPSAVSCEIVDTYILNCSLLTIGNNTVVVRASDGGLFDDETFTIKINDVPNITNFSAVSLNRTGFEQYTSAVTFEENETIRFEADITDVDDSTHWYSWFLDGILQVAGYGKYFFEWVTGFFTAREQPYNITVIVNDSNNAQTSQEWSVNITNVNRQPFFVEGLVDQTIPYDKTGQTPFVYDVNCSDPDNDSITYYDSTEEFEINISNGLIEWVPGEEDIKVNEFEVICSDDNYSVSQNFTVTVVASPDLSVSSGDISFSDNNPDTGDEVWISAVVYNLGDVDAENVNVKFYDGTTVIGNTTVSVPKYFNNKDTAEISWTPTENGTHVIKVSVNEPHNPKEISYDNNKATKAIRVGQLIIGGIVVDAGSLTPDHALRFASVRASGHAYYNTTFGLGENVAGALVTVTINDVYAGSGRTLNDGTFNFYVIVSDLSPDDYEFKILVDDATLTGEKTGSFTVDTPQEPKPDLYISKVYSDPKKPLDNETSKLKAEVKNSGSLPANSAVINFTDNGNERGTTTINVPAGGSAIAEIDWTQPIIGAHNIIVTADPDNTIAELNENNNERSKEIKVYNSSEHKPDLEPSLSISGALFVDEPVDISVTVYNRGVVDATNVKVTAYDEYIDNYGQYQKDYILPEGTLDEILAVSPNIDEIDGYSTIPVPDYKFKDSIDDKHNVTVEVDYLDEIKEISELNNNISKPYTVSNYHVGSDFEPISLTFSKNNPKIGEEVTVISVIQNHGRDHGWTNVSFFIDEGNEIIADELYIQGQNGQNSTSRNIIINESGSYNIKVAADPRNEIIEQPLNISELNNNLTKQLTVYPYLAELRTFSEYINFSDDYPDEGSNLTVTVKVENLGEISASNFTVTLDRDGGYNADIIPSSTTVESLGVNQNVPVEFTWVNVTGNGSHVIRARVNPERTVQESNYADNDATRSVIVGDFADFYVLDDDVVFNDTLEVNKSVRMDVTVHNGGTIEGSAVVKIYDGSTLLHNETITVNYDNSTVVSTDWMPKKFDNTLTIEVVDVTPVELDYADNTLIKNVHINVAPVLIQNIPDNTTEEDTSVILNMNDYFKDDNDLVLNYIYTSNNTNVKIEFPGTYIKYANISATQDWYGSSLLSITAFDDEGANVTSNEFAVTFTPVNDQPWWDSIGNATASSIVQNGGEQPIGINASAYFRDVENDKAPWNITISTNQSEVDCFMNTGANFSIFCNPTSFSGNFIITLIGIDAGGLSAKESFEAYVSSVSNAPVWSPIGDIVVNEDFTNFTVSLNANISDFEDPDSSLQVSYSLNSSDWVVTIDNSTNIMTVGYFTPNAYGAVNISLAVIDTSNLTAFESFDLIVNAVNDAPWNDGLANPSSVGEDSGLNNDVVTVTQLDASFRDVEEDHSPSSYAIQSQTGSSIINCVLDGNNNVDCTTQANQSGSNTVTVRLSDSGSLHTYATFTITVNPVNDAPWNDGLANPSNVGEDSGIRDNVITVTQLNTAFRDVEEDHSPSSYAIQSQTGSSIINCVLDGNNNVDCTTQANQSGSNTVTVRLSDSGSLHTYATFTITVNPVNDAPWNDGLANPSNVDEESGTHQDVVTYAQIATSFRDVEEDKSPSSYAIQSQTGSSIINCVLDGNNNVDCTTQANQSGSNTVTVRLSDSNSLYTDMTFTITVNNINDAPWWDPIPYANNISEDGGYQNVLADYRPYFRDVEDDKSPIFVSVTTNQSKVSCSENSGTILCQPSFDFFGDFTINLTAKDSGNYQISQTFNAFVISVDDVPWWDEIGNATAININEDSGSQQVLANYSNYFRDVEDDNAPQNPSVSTNESDVTCVESYTSISCTPVNNFTGDFIIILTAEDSAAYSITQSFEGYVTNVNDLPVIESFNASSLNRTGAEQFTSAVTFEENETVRFEVEVEDPDAETHWYSWFVDGILQSLWSGFGKNIFEWVTGFFTAREEPYNVTVVVNDSGNVQVVQEWSVNVTDVNGPPFFVEDLEYQTIAYDKTGQTPFVYDVNCSDPDNDSITYYDNTGEFEIDVNTGLIEWTPGEEDIGDNAFTITCATDEYNTSDTLNVNVDARPDLSVSSADISFSDNNPDTGDEVLISAVIYNLGDVDAENVNVKFYDGNTVIGSTTVSVPKYFNNKDTTQISWTPTENGTHVIKVSVNEPHSPEEISYDNNKATKAIRVGQLIIGGIVVDAGSLTPDHALRFASVRASGHAYYNTTFGLGENVAGALVTVMINDVYAGSGRTLNDGTFNFYATVPDLSPDDYEFKILVDDATLTGERTGSFTVDTPSEPKPDLYISKVYSDPKKPLDNETSKLKAEVKNSGSLPANSAVIKFTDNGNEKGTTTVNVPAGGSAIAEIDWTQPIIGPHNIIVTADPDNIIAELNENNNEQSKEIKVYNSSEHKPDLGPALSVPQEIYVDQPVDITVKVYNRGVVDATNALIKVYDEYNNLYLGYTKDVIDSRAVSVVAVSPNIDEVDGYETYTFQYIFASDRVPPQLHNITVEADPLNSMDEVLPQGEQNNNITESRTIKSYPFPPDFEPISLTFSKTNPKIGEEITATPTIKNKGYTPSWTNISFFIDENNEVLADEIYILGRGGTNSTSVNLMINESGTYNIKVAVDPRNEVDERPFPEAELNNNLTKQLTVYPYLAELRTFSEYINFSDEYPDEGSNLMVTVKVENLGEISASNFTVTLDRDGGYIADIVPNSVVIDSLGVNSNVPVEFTWVNVTGNGSHVIRARINPEHAVQESNYADNDATRSVIVGDFADFYVLDNDVVFNDTLEVNKSVKIDITVHNGGTIEGSATVNIYDGSDLLHSENVTVNYDSSTVVSTDWMPTKFDSILTIEAVYVTPVELDYADNTLIKNVHINVAPTLVQNIPDNTTEEDTSVILNMNDYFKDDNDLVLNYIYTSNNTNVKIKFTGAYIKYANISATQDWYGSSLLSITAFDDEGANVTSNNFVVVVNPVNDHSWWDSISNATYYLSEDLGVQPLGIDGNDFNASSFFRDVENDQTPDNISVNTNTTSASCSVESNLSVFCNVINNLTGSFIVILNGTDNGNAYLETSFDVNITAVNDAPWNDTLANPSAINEDGGAQDVITKSTISSTWHDLEDAMPTTYEIIKESNTSIVDCQFDSSNNLECLPQANKSGTSEVLFAVNDSGGLATLYYVTVTVNPVNDNPWNDGLANPSNVDEESGTHQDVVTFAQMTTSFRDVEEDKSPSSCVLYSQTGSNIINCVLDGSNNVDCTTQVNKSGSNLVTIRCKDSGNLYTNMVFTITVNNINDAPWWDPIPYANNISEDGGYQNVLADYRPYFRDVENDKNPIFVSAISNETSVSCSESNGAISCNPVNNFNGDFITVLTAQDSNGYQITQSFEGFVIAVNDAPVITTYNASSLNRTGTEQYTSAVVFEENETVSFAVEVSDVDDDQHWYEWFFDSVLTFWGWGKNVFEKAFDFDDAGEHNVTVIVNDSNNAQTAQEWGVNVTNINRLPYLYMEVPGITFDEDGSYTINLYDYFHDDDTEHASNLGFDYEVNDTNVNVSFANGVANVSATDNWYGHALMNFTATDPEQNSTKSNEILVIVNPINDPPYFIEGLTDQTTLVNEPFIYDVNCSDIDSYVTYYNNDSEVGIDSSSGLINWTPTIVEVRSVEIICSDGVENVSQSFSINISAVNHNPEINIPDQEFEMNTQKSLNLSDYSSDVDNDSLSYNITDKNVSEVDCQISDDNLTMIPVTDWYGLASCTVQANDGKGGVNSSSFDINITFVDTTPPIITDTNNLNGTTFPSGTTEVKVNITTDEVSYCEYSTTNNSFAFDEGTPFETTGSLEHSLGYTSLTDGNYYNVSVKCNDTNNNYNVEDWFVSFGVNVTVEQCLADTVSYWKLDENEGNVTGNNVDNHNGTIYGATWSGGKVNNGLSFDGTNDYVAIPDNSAWSFGSNNYAVEFWVKRNETQVAYAAPISQWSGSGTDRAFLAYFDTDNKLKLGINGVYPVITSDVLIDDNTWYHVVIVRDGPTSTKMYLNGEQTGTTYTTNYNMVDSNADLLLGSQQGGTNYFFKGLIDEVAVYNRSLTMSEIQEHYLKSEYYSNGYCKAYIPVYNNGVVDVGEGCDDGNTASGDGCNSTCNVEEGYACNGIPSTCCTDTDADGVCDSTDSCNNTYAPTGMISYWGFEEGTGIKTDDSHDSHDGTLVNNVSRVGSQVGNALSFDGSNDFVRVYDSEDWYFETNNYTISFWIKRNGNQASYAAPISQWSGSGTDRAFLAYFDTDNKLKLGINGVYPVITSDVLTDNTWYYTTVVRDGLTSTKMYLNGVQNGTTYTTNYNMSNSATDLLFGSQQGGTNYFFKGLLDEVAIYNRSLTEDEISQHYNYTISGNGYCTT